MKANKPSADRLAELALFTAGLAYGGSTPIGRELGVWLKPPSIVALRFVLTLPFCLIGLSRQRRSINVPLVQLVPVALLFPISATLFTYSFFHASIAVAIFGYYISNLLSSLLLGVLHNHEPFDRATILAVSFSIIATAFIAFSQSGGHGSNDTLGFLLAVASGLCNTGIAQEQKRLSTKVDGASITLAQVVGGIIFSVIFAIAVNDHSISNLTGTAFSLGVLYGFFFFLCNRLMVFGFRDGPIGLGSVLLSIEVVVGPLLALIFFNQHINGLQLIGGAFTAAAVVSTARRATPEAAPA